jgi:hypothetical protein
MSRRGKRVKKQSYDDFFGMDSDEDDQDDFFGIDDDFKDPFEDMVFGRGFGFPNIEELHNRLFGRFNRHLELGEEEDEEENPRRRKNKEGRRGLQRRGMNNFHEFMSMEGMGPETGTVISKSYCSKIDYSDGQPHEECYQSQSINQIKDGHKISEKQEAYKNSRTGVQKAAHQRILDDKGTKQIRQRNVNTGVQEEHNIFKGMREDELDDFNEKYNDYRQKTGFQNQYRYLDSMNKRGRKQKYIEKEDSKGNTENSNQYPQLGDGRKNNTHLRKPYKKHYAK